MPQAAIRLQRLGSVIASAIGKSADIGTLSNASRSMVALTNCGHACASILCCGFDTCDLTAWKRNQRNVHIAVIGRWRQPDAERSIQDAHIRNLSLTMLPNPPSANCHAIEE